MGLAGGESPFRVKLRSMGSMSAPRAVFWSLLAALGCGAGDATSGRDASDAGDASLAGDAPVLMPTPLRATHQQPAARRRVRVSFARVATAWTTTATDSWTWRIFSV